MSDAQIEAVGWIAVVFLGLAALLWLADLVLGIVKNDDQRKILNRTIGGTFLGGIVAGSVAVLGGDDPGVEPIPQPTETQSTTPTSTPTEPPVIPIPTPTLTDEEAPGPSPSPSPTPSPTPSPPVETPVVEEEVTCLLPHPSEVRERGNRVLRERPNLRCYQKKDYPTCVADLQSPDPEEVSKLDARDCSREVEAWRADYVSPVEEVRLRYLRALTTAEIRARSDQSEEGVAWFEHIKAEIKLMNGTRWKAYNEVVKRSQTDMDRCWNNKCAPVGGAPPRQVPE